MTLAVTMREMPSERWFRRHLPVAGMLCLAWIVYRIATAHIPRWQDYLSVISVFAVLFHAWLTSDRVGELEEELDRERSARGSR